MGFLQSANPDAKKKEKYIGAYVSDALFEHFTLLSLTLGVTKSVVLNDLLESYLKLVKNSKLNLIDQLTDRLIELEKESDSKSFLKDIICELDKKGLNDKLIKEITRKYEKKQQTKG